MIRSKILVVEISNGRATKCRRSVRRPKDFGCSRPDLVVLDIRLRGMDGLDAMGRMLHKNSRVKIREILDARQHSVRRPETGSDTAAPWSRTSATDTWAS